MNPLLLRYLPYLGGALVIAGAFWWAHHSGYESGQAEREAYYKPILTAAQSIANAAEARLKAQERDSVALAVQREKTHAATETALQARLAAAERRVPGLVQELSAARRTCAGRGSPSDPGTPTDTPGEPERLERVAVALTGLAKRAERDAQRLGECQAILRDERTILSR